MTYKNTDFKELSHNFEQYIEEIWAIPLLTAQEEVELSKRRHTFKKKARQAAFHVPKFTKLFLKDVKKEKENISILRKIVDKDAGIQRVRLLEELNIPYSLVEKYMKQIHCPRFKEHNKKYNEAKSRLIEGNLRLAVNYVLKSTWKTLPLMDLIQEANCGLIDAAERFDWRLGNFATYASYWLKQSVNKWIDEFSKNIRLPSNLKKKRRLIKQTYYEMQQELDKKPSTYEIAERLGIKESEISSILKTNQYSISLDHEGVNLIDKIENMETMGPAECFFHKEEVLELKNCLASLNNKEYDVILRRYGLHPYNKVQTLEEVCKKYPNCKENIRQIEKNALKKMQRIVSIKESENYNL